jgi:hypothetical protein
MRRTKFTDEKIACALRQTESGTAVANACRQTGISDATFSVWKEKCASLGATELLKLRSRDSGGSAASRCRISKQRGSGARFRIGGS